MLNEISIARKADGAYERRWYEDERADLFVWFSPNGDIERFQLTYDKPNSEKTVDWKRGHGFTHMLVDDGKHQGLHPSTPLLNIGGTFAKDRVIKYFREHAANIDTDVSTFVLKMLQKCPRTSASGRKSKLPMIGALIAGMLVAWRLLR